MKNPNEKDLLAIGRQFAGDILKQSVETAKTPEQLNGQLHVANCMAVHIIATNIFNRSKSFEESESHIIMEIKEEIENELEMIKASSDEMELVQMKES
jgi:hypothetical protein